MKHVIAIVSVVLLGLILQIVAQFNIYPKENFLAGRDVKEDGLFLTPFIERGDIIGGQKAAAVQHHNNATAVNSYSGYLTVNRQYNSNLFFWFFPAEINNYTAPLVIWLQGGPGASSLFGLFEEHGPFYISKNQYINRREYYWTKTLNVIYIDNPVGTGFSFTENTNGYAQNQVDVGNDLYIAVRQFLALFPQYKKNDLYITGESYAGKYVPALAHTIDEYNEFSKEKINLKGIAIGDGLCDPKTMLNYADYLYAIGLIDINVKEKMNRLQNIALELIDSEEYEQATEIFDRMILGDSGQKTVFQSSSGFDYYYNFLHFKDDSIYGNLEAYINTSAVRKAIHVGNRTYNSGQIVHNHLKADISKSVKPWFEKLMEKYKVLLYSGQLDIIIAYPLTLNFIQSLNWSGAQQYRLAERKLWFVDDELAGYSKTVGNFTELLVRNAGHMVPADQPKWASDLIHRFTNNIPF